MNLPEYTRAIRAAATEYEETCSEARDRFHKALAVAQEAFFEDAETHKAVAREDAPRR